MRNLTISIAILISLAGSLLADQYWVAYEGNDFPENEGWFRVQAAGGAIRSIENGVLTLDGSASVAINDLYGMPRNSLDPEAGEAFRMEWRTAIDSLVGTRDPGVALFSDESWAAAFSWSQDFVRSEFEFVDIPFQFEGFHEFVLESEDMRSYTLFVDGIQLHQGTFVQVVSHSRVSWGDGVEGAASTSRWDYVRFGVVPEPTSAALFCIVLVIASNMQQRRRSP